MTTTESTAQESRADMQRLVHRLVADEGLPQPAGVRTSDHPDVTPLRLSLRSRADLDVWAKRIDTDRAAPDHMRVVTRVWLVRTGTLAGVETLLEHELLVPPLDDERGPETAAAVTS